MSASEEVLNADFLGGPPESFVWAGREQLVVLLEHGLTFQSRVLDIGCGCLRGGRWIIPLLERGHYYGLEPMKQMVEKGLTQFVDPKIVTLKQPCFDYNDRFDFSVFGTKFSHFLARSIWTHASKSQIEKMLDGLVQWGTEEAVMLASFLPASSFGRGDYQNSDWVGRSQKSDKPGIVRHRFWWIVRACVQRGLTAERVDRAPLARHGQVWVVVRRTQFNRPRSMTLEVARRMTPQWIKAKVPGALRDRLR